MGKTDEYADAIRTLEQMYRQGRYTDAEYELKKQRLIAEATHRPLPLVVRLFLGAVGMAVAFVIAVFVLSAVGGLIG